MNPNLPPARYPCDLHCHTTRSDGHDSPLELIATAVDLGLHAVAITDHDLTPPCTVELNGGPVDSRAYAAEEGLTLVLGYEFSTNTWVDDVHICGYALAWDHPDLQAEVAAASRSKIDGYAELCRRLTAQGMPVDWETDILSYTTPAGKPARRLPEEVQRKHIFEAMAARGYAPSWSAAKLLVRDAPELNVRRRKIDPHECLALIHRCGGIAVLAHPFLIDAEVHLPDRPPLSRLAYIDELVEGGLDGIEVRYTYDKTTYKGDRTPEELEAETRARYGSRVRILSGGSDYHADHKKSAFGSNRLRSLGERGLTVAEFEPLREWFLHGS